MCYFMASEHSCGHLHQWFARCYHAKHDQTGACTLQTIPTWHYPEVFPCPECRAQRKTDTEKLLEAKGRHMDPRTNKKIEPPKQEYFQDVTSRMHTEQDAYPHIAQQDSVKSRSRDAQLQNMAEGALNLPLLEPSAHTPWVPPSRRHTSVVGQLGSSSPPRARTNDSASTHSPESLSVDGSSRPSLATSPPYPPQEQPAEQKILPAGMHFAHMLQ